MYAACRRGDGEKVSNLLKRARGRYASERHGPLNDTPLHAAVEGDSAACVRLLLDSVPSLLRIANEHGKSALHIACELGRVDCSSLLLSSAIDEVINLRDKQGCTALMRAAIAGHSGVLEELVRRGAHMDIIDDFGMCALFRTCVLGHEPCARVLCNAGATLQPSQLNAKLLPHILQRSAENGHIACVQLVRERLEAKRDMMRGRRVVVIDSPLVLPAMRFLAGCHAQVGAFDPETNEFVIKLDGARFAKTKPLKMHILALEPSDDDDAVHAASVIAPPPRRRREALAAEAAASAEAASAEAAAAEAASAEAAAAAEAAAMRLLDDEERSRRDMLRMRPAKRPGAQQRSPGGRRPTANTTKPADDAACTGDAGDASTDGGGFAEGAQELLTEESSAVDAAPADAMAAAADAAAVAASAAFREREMARERAELVARREAAAEARKREAAAREASERSCPPATAPPPRAPTATNVAAIVHFAAATAEANASQEARIAAERAGLQSMAALRAAPHAPARRPPLMVHSASNTEPLGGDEASLHAEIARLHARLEERTTELLTAREELAISQRRLVALSFGTATAMVVPYAPPLPSPPPSATDTATVAAAHAVQTLTDAAHRSDYPPHAITSSWAQITWFGLQAFGFTPVPTAI